MEEEITIDTLKLTTERVKKEATDDKKLIRIPPKLYQANPEAFTPQLVSIGPFHHIGHNFTRFKDVNILAMEGKKRAYMLSLFQIFGDGEEGKLEACKTTLQENSERIWQCYSEETDMSEELLVKIMLVDGCFILGLLLGQTDMRDHAVGRYPRDLALLENQLPFFVLEALAHHCNFSTNIIIWKLLQFFRLTPIKPPLEQHIDGAKHLLDLISICHHPACIEHHVPNYDSLLRRYHDNINIKPSKGIHLMNATKLWDAGVTFHCASGHRLLEVFFFNGKFMFVPLVIHECTETILMNLLAYEHLSPYSREYFTSYVVLMSHLIKTPEDFQLLEKQGILVNESGSREDASKIFSNISKHFVIKDFCYRILCDEVEAYANSRWLRYMQDLKRRCFNSPWTTVSVIAATVLLILTALQTIFSVLAYYQPKLT